MTVVGAEQRQRVLVEKIRPARSGTRSDAGTRVILDIDAEGNEYVLTSPENAYEDLLALVGSVGGRP